MATTHRIKEHIKSDINHHMRGADKLAHDGKRLASNLYHDGLDRFGEGQEAIKEYSALMIKQVKDKPVHSLLIAAGIGFILSFIFRK